MSVSLDGNRLAADAQLDGGFGNIQGGAGAVHLFTFTDGEFGGGTFEATIGKGYDPVLTLNPKDIDLTALDGDQFGLSVSLDGNRVVAGSRLDDEPGVSNSNDFGAVYLFSFTDSTFGGGQLEGTIGEEYVGGKKHRSQHSSRHRRPVW